ncbi:hypothetical protein CFP56_035732 [Quercus suber]|uniref:Uncharacterized protein n=1 Tax=Quercus suber TaxID=58331 RepID=A0AAW0J9Z0_QUESU
MTQTDQQKSKTTPLCPFPFQWPIHPLLLYVKESSKNTQYKDPWKPLSPYSFFQSLFIVPSLSKTMKYMM